MNISGIIAISGRPGLFKVIAQGKNNVIVESLVDRKRFPAYSSDRISALEDISIYTYEDEKPLKEIFSAIHEKENGEETISHKEKEEALTDYLMTVLPNYDQEKVYISDIKKIFQWYNLLHKSGELKIEETVEGKSVEKELVSTSSEIIKEKEAPVDAAPVRKTKAAKTVDAADVQSKPKKTGKKAKDTVEN
jgi:hypothetical protein